MGTANDNPETPSEQLPDKPENPPMSEMSPAADTPEEQTPSQAEYFKSIMPPAKSKRKKWPLIVVVTVLLVAALGGTAYWYVTQHHTAKISAVTSKHNTTPPVTPTITNSDSGGPTTHYVSNGNDLNLDFDYPSSWTVTPPTNDNANDQTITLTSPSTSFTNASGAATTGKVVVLIRPGTAQLSELGGGASAAQTSTQIAYTKPTTAQHQYPYLTFLHLGSGNSTAFQEVVVTGTLQFTQGQAVSASSLSVDPIISASFYSCSTAACTGSGAQATSTTYNNWQNDAIFHQTLAVFESMQLN